MAQYPIHKLEEKFKVAADPSRALQMEKYMKDRFPFFGIQANPRRAICSEFMKEYGLPEKKDLFEVISQLWEKEEREFQHFGAELANRYKKNIEGNDLEMYRWMLVQKSWWDSVDFIAANLVGSYFRIFKQNASPTMKDWLDTNNMWLQRTTLIFQLKYKKETDLELLSRQIKALKDSKEFFIRKAIGWSLREYSKTDPDWVQEFVSSTQLSPLSKREALKRINA
ncbi:MAG: DNA alkylation repair protein [Bacteroidales bacterium]|nr:DNA alkylation repair protein [Bacteroidales bacterium]